MSRRVIAVCMVCLGSASGALAGGDDSHEACARAKGELALLLAVPPFDPDTGRDLRNYPPHRLVDTLDMRLEIVIPDMNDPRAHAREFLTLAAIAEPVSTLTLDARLLEIVGVASPGRGATYRHDGRTLTIELNPALDAGARAEVVIDYTIVDPPFGLIWTPESPAWPGRAAQLHTQGQPETNSYWFPCHDFPNERLTTELVVTVPSGYLVSANGKQLRRGAAAGRGLAHEILLTRQAPARGHETFVFRQDPGHVNYLVSLVVGKFDVVDVGSRRLPLPVYAPPGRGGDVRRTYGATGDMVALYGRLFDEAYPWDKYAQVIVWNFGPGGMENTSATTMHDTAILSTDGALDHEMEGLISHELGHQWFGDLITCNSWEHIWLNEGFATYLSWLWWEHSRGPDAYSAAVLGGFDAIANNDRGMVPTDPGMASKAYTDPWEVFRRAANPYSKGASVLHMLRHTLGDDVFFKGVALYIDRRRFNTAESSDLRAALEEVSGRSLDRFFAQWVERPGVPRLDVSWTYDVAGAVLGVDVEQTQTIDELNPAFVLDLPVWVGMGDGSVRRGIVPVRERVTSLELDLDQRPAWVVIDPEPSVLAEIRTPTPGLDAAIALVNGGPTMASRIRAARVLGSIEDPTGRCEPNLASIAGDERASRDIRIACVDALAARGSGGVLLKLLQANIRDANVRAQAVDRLGDACVRGDDSALAGAAEEAVRLIRTDRASRVVAGAIRTLDVMGDPRLLDAALDASTRDSQHDTIRQAALRALASCDSPLALDRCIELARPGVYNRTRPVAIESVVALAHHNPERAYQAIAATLGDRERRAWESAARALAALRDPRGIDVLARALEAKRDPADRRILERARDELSRAIEAAHVAAP